MPHIDEQKIKHILHYKILEILGKGGNGTVYRVENTKTGHILALKTLNTPTEVTLNRFKKEYFSLKKMDHEGIVKVFNSYFDHSPPFFSMEWIQGKTLGRIISDMKKNPLIFAYQDREDFTREVCRQLCSVLTYLHSFDEIHRDLKPENIFITQGQGNLLKGFSIKILDFGLLKQLNSHQANRNTQQGMVVGTVQFLSPEQAKGGHLDARSDLFSVGVILYNILALDLPFHAKDLVAYLFQIVFEEPIPIRERVPEISPKMEHIVQTLLHKDPGKRFPSSQALLRALESTFNSGAPLYSDIRAEDFIPDSPLEGFGDPLLPPCLVARDEEIQNMLHIAHQLGELSPEVILIKGESGLGKTFLINEWLSQLRFEKKTVFKQTFASQTTPTQNPVGMLMDSLIKEMAPEEILATFKDIYPFLSGVSRYLSRFFDMRSIGSLEHLSSARKLQLIATNFNKLIVKMAAKGPVIMILEDTHLAPERFFGWLTLFLEQLNTPKFMLIMSFDSNCINPAQMNFVNRINNQGITHQISLPPISQNETRTLLKTMIPVNKEISFSKSLDQFIFQNSSGNPHLAIELFTRLYEEKGLIEKNGIVERSGEASIRMPQSIHQALLLKIQKLPPSAMELVEAASTFGDEFELSWLQELLKWEEETFFSLFQELVRAGVFREEEDLVQKVYFQNSDLRNLVYAGLSGQRKNTLHKEAAHAIEKLYNRLREDTNTMPPERMSLFLENLSLHFSRCHSFVHATKYAYFSGNLALEQKNTTKAISFYKECLKMMNYSASKHTLNLVNLKLGEVFLADHRFDEAISYFETSLKAKKKSKVEELRLFKGLTEAFRHLGNFTEALKYSNRLVALSHSCSPKVTADSLIGYGFLIWEKEGNGKILQEHILQAQEKAFDFPHKDYLKTFSSLVANDLKNTITYIKEGKEKNISPTPFLVTLAWLNYMSGQFKKGFAYLDALKKGESQHPVDPRAMIFKSLLTYLLKRKIAPDHSADEYIHMAHRYQERFDLQNYKIHIDLIQLENLTLHQQSEKACQLIESYKNGSKKLPDTFFERKLFLCMALNAIWRQIEVPPREWLNEFKNFEPEAHHPINLAFHHALALNSNALLPLSGKIQNAADAMRRSSQQLNRFSLKYYQSIMLKNQIELFEKLEEETILSNLQEEYRKLLPKLK